MYIKIGSERGDITYLVISSGKIPLLACGEGLGRGRFGRIIPRGNEMGRARQNLP